MLKVKANFMQQKTGYKTVHSNIEPEEALPHHVKDRGHASVIPLVKLVNCQCDDFQTLWNSKTNFCVESVQLSQKLIQASGMTQMVQDLRGNGCVLCCQNLELLLPEAIEYSCSKVMKKQTIVNWIMTFSRSLLLSPTVVGENEKNLDLASPDW